MQVANPIGIGALGIAEVAVGRQSKNLFFKDKKKLREQSHGQTRQRLVNPIGQMRANTQAGR